MVGFAALWDAGAAPAAGSPTKAKVLAATSAVSVTVVATTAAQAAPRVRRGVFIWASPLCCPTTVAAGGLRTTAARSRHRCARARAHEERPIAAERPRRGETLQAREDDGHEGCRQDDQQPPAERLDGVVRVEAGDDVGAEVRVAHVGGER